MNYKIHTNCNGDPSRSHAEPTLCHYQTHLATIHAMKENQSINPTFEKLEHEHRYTLQLLITKTPPHPFPIYNNTKFDPNFHWRLLNCEHTNKSMVMLDPLAINSTGFWHGYVVV